VIKGKIEEEDKVSSYCRVLRKREDTRISRRKR
jgi:hypothetical protein